VRSQGDTSHIHQDTVADHIAHIGSQSHWAEQLVRARVVPVATVTTSLVWFMQGRGDISGTVLQSCISDVDAWLIGLSHMWHMVTHHITLTHYTHREEGDLGPVYGFQWRHFGAEYKDMHADYTGGCCQGMRQQSSVIGTCWGQSQSTAGIKGCRLYRQ
jgi:thymidylate synthase